jgi:hypothetical protein
MHDEISTHFSICNNADCLIEHLPDQTPLQQSGTFWLRCKVAKTLEAHNSKVPMYRIHI